MFKLKAKEAEVLEDILHSLIRLRKDIWDIGRVQMLDDLSGIMNITRDRLNEIMGEEAA